MTARGRFKLYGLRLILGLHFCLTLYYFAKVCGVTVETLPKIINGPVAMFADFRSANRYYLFEHLASAHYQVDFEGTNDGGKSWRTYPMRQLPQQVDRMAGFIAPRFPRFENTIFFESARPGTESVISVVAAHLLRRNPEVMRRFKADPFADRPPTVIRMRRYQLTLTDPATRRRTGRYWRKEFAGDYLPARYLTPQGEVVAFGLEPVEAALAAKNPAAALAICESQYALGDLEAGFRLAELHTRGAGGTPQLEKAFALFSELAERGELKALHNVGLFLEHGVGVARDPVTAAEAYRRAADGGFVLAMFAVGKLAATDQLQPRADIDGLAWLLAAAERAKGEEPVYRLIREEQPALVRRLMERMPAEDIAKARALALSRR